MISPPGSAALPGVEAVGGKNLAEQPKNDLSLRDSVYTVVAIPGSSENAKIEQPHAFSCLEKVAPQGRMWRGPLAY